MGGLNEDMFIESRYPRFNMCKIITVSWYILFPFYDLVIIGTQSNNYSSKKLQLIDCETFFPVLLDVRLCVCARLCMCVLTSRFPHWGQVPKDNMW